MIMWNPSEPPPPRPFKVLSRYGKDKFKVFAFGTNRIMSREQVIAYARTSKRNGAYVSLSGLIPEEELGE